MKPVTTIAEWPDCAWELTVLVAVGMALEGTVSTVWLAEETGVNKIEYEKDR